MNDLINESELLIRDPAFYIDDYFAKLRNEIGLFIENIELKYEKIMDKIKEIETKCKQNAQNKEPNSKLEKKTKLAKEKLNEYTKNLEFNLNP